MTKPNFKSDFFKANRERLKQELNRDCPIAIVANGLVQLGGDYSYPFVQDANFWYLSGINDPDVILVIDGDREFLIVPVREESRVAFDGQIEAEALTKTSGISDIVNEVSGWKRLDSLISKSQCLATLAAPPAYIEQYGMYANPARARFLDRVERHMPGSELVDIRPHLARLRMIKQAVEIDALTSAIRITEATLAEVLAKPADSYDYEYQIEADITHGFRYRGADGHAFEPVVAGGLRACTLHNVSNSAKLSPGELVVIDVGAAVSGYAADITRVRAMSKPTQRQKDVYAAVKEAQAYAVSLLGPGISLRTYETKVAKFVGVKLKQLGVTKNSSMSTIRQYFPHATSHFVGLNVHDVGDYQRPLPVGAVLAVEPGIYLPQEGIGVRLEDDFLITKTGVRKLSSGLPLKL